MRKICVTGGAGFVASHLTDHLCGEFPLAEIVVVDKFGYASRKAYLGEALQTGQLRVVEGSVSDRALMREVLKDTDLVVHAAAESHVDNSYRDVQPFLESNVIGSVALLQAAIDNNVGLFFHVSTDEVYGGSDSREFTDADALNPTNPYAASKASAELFVQCYSKSYQLPTVITRANNMFGTRQYPEKLIPKLICDAIRGKTFRVHGTGSARRSFLHVADFCQAVTTILEKGEHGSIYNVPALREYSVMEIVDLVSQAMGTGRDSLVEYGEDRPHNDSRYGVVGDKILALGWRPLRSLEDDLAAIIEWYEENLELYYSDTAARPARVDRRATWHAHNFGQTVQNSFAGPELIGTSLKRPNVIDDTIQV